MFTELPPSTLRFEVYRFNLKNPCLLSVPFDWRIQVTWCVCAYPWEKPCKTHRKLGKSWENHGKNQGKWENTWETYGKIWEDHRKSLGKYGKIIGQS